VTLMRGSRSWMAAVIRGGLATPALLVSACGGYTPNLDLLAKGPSPEFSGQALLSAANNQNDVLAQLSRMAGLDPKTGPTTPDEWAQFGAVAFGRARIECNAYITEIMKVEEHRRTINQELSLAGAATAGILGITGAAGVAIAITAMAFGLVQGSVDNVATGLLYSLGAEPVQALVASLRAAYTEKLTPSSWKNRATSFNLIYGYLELCTPVVLREKIKSAVATAQPVASNVDSMGGPPRVSLATQAQVQAQVIPTPRTEVPQAPPRPVRPTFTSPREAGVSELYVRQLQDALCIVPADGNLGSLPKGSSITRTAMREYLSGLSGGNADPATQDDEISRGGNYAKFDQAIDDAFVNGAVSKCAARGGFLSNAYEAGRWGKFAVADRAKEFRDLLAKMQHALGLPVASPADSDLEETTRNVIVQFRDKQHVIADMPNSQRGFDYTLTRTVQALPD
jgi:hypothetical protein